MADCAGVRMTIGGRLRSLLALRELVEAAVADDAVVDLGNEERDPDEALLGALVRGDAGKGSPLVLTSGSAPGGMLEAVEAACDRHGLDYIRADAGHYTWEPTHTAVRGGVATELLGEMDNGPAVRLADLIKASRPGAAEDLDCLVHRLERAFGPIGPLCATAALARRLATRSARKRPAAANGAGAPAAG